MGVRMCGRDHSFRPPHFPSLELRQQPFYRPNSLSGHAEMNHRLPLFLLSVLCGASFAAVQLPYGVEEGDEELKFPEPGLVLRRSLPKQLSFFEQSHSAIFVSANGAVSFDAPFNPDASELDLERKNIVAVFYAPSTGGKVFYRSADRGNPLTKELSAKIRRAFNANAFEADAVVLVTWDEVLGGDRSNGNTYQLALAADANDTYALLVYSSIRWVKAQDRFAQAGFFSADGRSEKLLNSGSPAIGDVIKVSNFNEPGLFIYRVSGSHPVDPRHGRPVGAGEEEYEYPQEQQEYDQEDQIAECPPDPYRDACPPNCNVVLDDNHCSLCICSSVISENLVGSAYQKHLDTDVPHAMPPVAEHPAAHPQQPVPVRAPDLSCTPQQGHSQCHSSANCLQHQSGYCCECENGHLGNGVECLRADGPLRINGVFEGALNGKQVQRTDLFAYIQLKEGQQHTALAKVPPEVGWSLLLLDTLSTPFGWLFAKTSGSARNGFQLTGGNFTRTVNIHLGDRYALTVRQEFTDRQFSEHFSVKVFVSGTLPELRGPVQVSAPEFEETYRRERPGLVRAYSERYILVRGDGAEERKYRLTTDQQIHFVECPHKQPESQTVVKFERLNAAYSEAESVVRFASLSHLVVDGGTGTEAVAEQEGAQQQQDACSSGRHFCTLPNMKCVPTAFSYRCECRPGFHLVQDNSVEQGMVCQLQQGADAQPQPIERRPEVAQEPEAPLQPGECSRHDQCHQWGECAFSSVPGQLGRCRCRGWYTGDGVSHCGEPEGPQSAPPQPIVQPTRGTMCRSDNDCGDNAHCGYSHSLDYYVCECGSGWQGDGIDCVAVVEAEEELNTTTAGAGAQAKQCAEQSDCHMNGHCVLVEEQSAYFCECLPGYTGDGVEVCEQAEECSPTDPAHCSPNQECRFEPAQHKFTCQCRSGFSLTPDGQCQFQLEQSPKCQQCGANAQCIRGTDGWNCVCNAGFTGNGMECRREANCLDEPTMCSASAQCLPDGSRAYLCVCNYGFAGDGRTCEPVVQRASRGAEALLIGRGMAIIQRAPEPSGTGKQLVVLPHQIVVDLEYDCTSERIIWSDISGHSIRSSLLNGSGLRTIHSDVLRSPEGIAIDPSAQNIYYLDSIKNELGVLSADGRFQKTLLREGLNNPRALVVDLEGRQLFYSDWSREGPKIGRMALDGSENRVFVSEDVHLPNGLVLLQQRRWLCWVDAGSLRLSCIGVDGSGRRVIYAPLDYPFGLTANSQEDRFYWTDWKDQKIHSVDVFGKGYQQFLPSAGGRGKLYGILSLPFKCQPTAPSECAHDNGGCAHWCLSGARHGSAPTCVCPENMEGLEGC